MKDMKLIMESWQQFTENQEKEELAKELQSVMDQYGLSPEQVESFLQQTNESVLNEGAVDALSRLVKQYGKRALTGALLLSTMMGAAAPGTAYAQDAPVFDENPITQQTRQVTSVTMQDDALMTQQLLASLMMVDLSEEGGVDEVVETIKKIYEIQNDKDLTGEIADALKGEGPQKNKYKDLGELIKRFKKPGQF
jgi:hypothetical protein